MCSRATAFGCGDLIFGAVDVRSCSRAQTGVTGGDDDRETGSSFAGPGHGSAKIIFSEASAVCERAPSAQLVRERMPGEVLPQISRWRPRRR
jgi:hypothetical protein